MKIFIALLVLVINLFYSHGTLPIIQQKCSTRDSECLKASAQYLVPFFASGIPEIGTEPLEPMLIDDIRVDQDGLKFEMRNIYVNGFNTTVIDRKSVDLNAHILQLDFHVDFTIKSQYTGGGYLFSLPFIGQGDLTARYKDIRIELSMPFDLIKDQNGRTVLSLIGYQYCYDVRGGGQHSLDNLYNGDKKSSDRMHALINQDWKILSIQYGRFLFDKINDKIFNAIRTYLLSQPIENTLNK